NTYTSGPETATPVGDQGRSAFRTVSTLPSGGIFTTQWQPVAAAYTAPRASTARPRRAGMGNLGVLSGESTSQSLTSTESATLGAVPSALTLRTALLQARYRDRSEPAARPETPSFSAVSLRSGANGPSFPSGEIRVSPAATLSPPDRRRPK